ncbi:MAG TPA: agmatinase [Syntrophales bacterium]|nr:agmatinase [Syntrophales bacterium]
MNFGGIEEQYAALEDAAFVVVPVPYDLTTTYQGGTRKGPAAVLEASCNMELYDEEIGAETYRSGIHTMEPLEPVASGPEGMLARIEEAVSGVFRIGKVPVMIGGEHSITLGAVRAARKRYPELTVLHLDAHADMRMSYQGTPYSHACIGRRMKELCPVVQAGIRSMSAEEADYLGKGTVPVFSAADIRKDRAWVGKVLRHLSNDVYITIDLDAFDPSVMPATGTPEPGGMLWHDVLDLLREVCRRKRVIGFDVVELAPIAGIVAPDFLAARLTYRVMGYVARKSG